MDVKELKKATECCIKMDCLHCPLGTVIGCDQKLANEVMAYMDELEERISIMQESMEAFEQRCKALEEQNKPIEPTKNAYGELLCGKCGDGVVGQYWITAHGLKQERHAFCRDCGQAVKWE